MSETWPYFYEHPYNICTQCSGSCFGLSCIKKGCDYIERASHNRFDPKPAIPGVERTCLKHPHTCRTVGNLILSPHDLVSPVSFPITNECKTKSKQDQFQVSQVSYGRL